MATLEITIRSRQEDTYRVVAKFKSTDAESSARQVDGFLTISPDVDQTLSGLKGYDVKKYGEILGQALFTKEIRTIFETALTTAKTSEEREGPGTNPLRLWLVVEDSELEKNYLWGTLCAPIDGGWPPLGTYHATPFSRYFPTPVDKRFPSIGRADLRALVVVACPAGAEALGLSSFDVPATVQSLSTAIGRDIPVEVLATSDGSDDPPTLDALLKRLAATKATLLHVVCHGAVRGNECALFLSDPNGSVDIVTTSRLIPRLKQLNPPPYFAFLSACHSASSEAEEAFGGLAQQLVRDVAMPAVVAMTARISIDTASELSSAFYSGLRDHGEPDRALVEATAGLAERPDILVPALYSRLGGRPIFEDKDGPLSAGQIEQGLGRLEEELELRAPWMLSAERKPADGEFGFSRAATTYKTATEETLADLSDGLRTDWVRASREIDQISLECLDKSFVAVATGQKFPPYDAREPFRGLSAFTEGDKDFFFGRETWVETLQSKLTERSFLPVLGQSGSGKSSLVYAGLIPAMKKREAALEPVAIRPGATPLVELQRALAVLPAQGGLLVVDQFEEIFTHCQDKVQRNEFFDLLLAQFPGHRVVLTMRADFWGECAAYPSLREVMKEHQEVIPPMTADELRQAMDLQTGAVGLVFEADLAATMIDEIRDEPGAMPLLQHALAELWKRRHGRWLKASEYRELGGVKQAISATAEEVYAALTEDERLRVRDIFIRLTRLDEDASRTAARDTRHRVRFRDLVPAGEDPAVTKELVHRLASRSLVVISGEMPGDERA